MKEKMTKKILLPLIIFWGIVNFVAIQKAAAFSEADVLSLANSADDDINEVIENLEDDELIEANKIITEFAKQPKDNHKQQAYQKLNEAFLWEIAKHPSNDRETLGELTFGNEPNAKKIIGSSSFTKNMFIDNMYRDCSSYLSDEQKNRLTEVKANKEMPARIKQLFNHVPKIEDVAQTRIGTCYFDTLIMSILQIDPYFPIKNMRDLNNGWVMVRFFEYGKPIYTLVHKSNCFEHCFSRMIDEGYAEAEPWVLIYEEAYAQSHLHRQNYIDYFNDLSPNEQQKIRQEYNKKLLYLNSHPEDIDFGFTKEMAKNMFANPKFRIWTPPHSTIDSEVDLVLPKVTHYLKRQEQLKKTIKTALNAKHLICADFKGTVLIRNSYKHVYSVLDITEENGFTFVTVRDPLCGLMIGNDNKYLPDIQYQLSPNGNYLSRNLRFGIERVRKMPAPWKPEGFINFRDRVPVPQYKIELRDFEKIVESMTIVKPA